MEKEFFNIGFVESQRMIYTPSTFAKESLAYLQEIGELQAQSPHTSNREGLQSYLFFIVESGAGTLHFAGNAYALNPGDCVFIDCRKDYSHRTSEDLWKLRWIHFYGNNVPKIYEKYLERGGNSVFHPKQINGFRDIWERVWDIAASPDYIRDMRINDSLNLLLTLLMAESRHPESQQIDAKKHNLTAIKAYLDTHYPEKILLDDLSSQFYINKFYLTRIFKKQFGLSVNQYLLQKRITNAKQLLRFSDKTVEVIATECGMGTANYFSRIFKKVEGLSPSEYRQLW